MKQNQYLLIIFSLLAIVLTGCGSTRNTAKVVKKTPIGSEVVTQQPTMTVPTTLSPQSQSLLNEASQWLGTPYKYGGESKSGVDCSGFVMQVYLSSLAIKLPRNSKEQSDYCTPTKKTELVPGDLLFFGSGKSISHVGIFIGDTRMIHASSSKGVIISDINEEYYLRNFKGSGKVEKYHSMIDNTTKVAPSTNKSISLEELSKQTISVASNSSVIEESTHATETPSPAVKTATVDKPAPAKKTVASAKPVPAVAPSSPITVAQTSSETIPEISVDDARKNVLNSIIEQKLDSIYSK